MSRPRDPHRMATAPDLSLFEGYVDFAFASIPEELRKQLRNVAIRVEDFASDEILQRQGIDSPFRLLGLYHGVPLTSQSVFQVGNHVDIIFLYRRPILEKWYRSRDDLFTIVRHVLIHEIGHHYGFSDENMERIERR